MTEPTTAAGVRRERGKLSSYSVIRPNSKPQWDFLATTADIALYGGAAGGGKTFALLMEAARNLNNPRFGAVFFRRTRPELIQEKGAWDKSEEIYYGLGGIPNFGELKWYFRSGSSVKFASMQHEKNIRDWGSAQIPLLLIDQAETFTEKMVWGLWSRCRTDIGMRPYLRMGCNPEPDSWLLKLFGWWIDKDGYAIPERSGLMRWMYRHGETIHFADSAESLITRFQRAGGSRVRPISITFIPAKLSDNVDLETSDPEYRSKLELLPFDERMRLLGDAKKGGNWKVKAGAGMFPGGAWRVIDNYSGNARMIRYWDTAATAYADPEIASTKAATASVLMGLDHEGPIVLDVTEDWVEDLQRDNLIVSTATLDRSTRGFVEIWLEQEGAGAGKDMAKHNLRILEGFAAYTESPNRDKVTRARPWASAVQSGRVRILARPWAQGFIEQHRAFPFASRKDLVDASSGAYNKLAETGPPATDTGIYSHNQPNFVDSLGNIW